MHDHSHGHDHTQGCEGHQHGHHHNHDHHHHDGPDSSGMSKKDEFKLRIARWRDHNREHQQSLAEWSEKMRAAGCEDAARAMDRAADLLGQSVAELEAALESLS